MTDRKRIDNPTCETCRWYRGLAGDESFTGECCLSPPELHYDQNGLSLPGLPEVNSDDFCSHHESAFEEVVSYEDQYSHNTFMASEPGGRHWTKPIKT